MTVRSLNRSLKRSRLDHVFSLTDVELFTSTARSPESDSSMTMSTPRPSNQSLEMRWRSHDVKFRGPKLEDLWSQT